MTTKSPVYHRTSDGRKVVIVAVHPNGKIRCFDKEFEAFYYYNEDELTPWVEPETRTVYVHWKNNGDVFVFDNTEKNVRELYKAIKKVPITEGEFDE